MRKAIVLVSFGSANLEGLKNTIYLLEDEIRRHFTSATVVTVFSSNMIISLLKERHNTYVKRLDKCLFDLANDLYEEVIIQPLNIMEEALNIEIQKVINEYSYSFKRIVMANSILSGTEDYLRERCNLIARSILDEDSRSPILLVGHGSKTYSNKCYHILKESFQQISGRKIFIATLEGENTLNKAIGEMNKNSVKDIVIQPLFLIKGKHLDRDIFGERDSWLSILGELGFNIDIVNKALLQYESIRNIYLNDLKSLF